MDAQELRERLIAERGAHPSNVGVPNEWVGVIDRLDQDLEALAPGYRLSQVKVKFGGLRYYVTWPEGTDTEVVQAGRDRITRAEREAGYLD